MAAAQQAAQPLAAQPADVRISPRDEPLFVLATDAKIQSAARVGTRTLVAWGTTVPDSIAADADKTTYRNELYFEILADANQMSLPQRLHEPDARPFGVVAVVNLRDRFLVLWSDRRAGAPGIYARTVDTNGAILGDAYRFAPGMLLREDAVWITPALDGSYLLVWGDSTGSMTRYYRANLDGNAHRVGAIDEIVQANFDDDLTFDELPGAHILRDSTGGRFVHAAGDTDARIIPGRFLYQPHYLAADTSIVVVEPGTGLVRWITFYRSVFDTVAVRRVRLVLPDGPVTTCALARDSIDRTLVVINQHVDPLGYFGYISGRLIRYLLEDDGTLGDSTYIAEAYRWYYTHSASYENNGGLNEYSIVTGDRNTVRLIYAYTQSTWAKQAGAGSTSHTTTILMLDGMAHRYTLDPATQAYTNGSTRERINLSRRNVADSSAVRVEFDSTNTRNVAVAIPATPQNLIQREPVIADVAGGPFVVWSVERPVPTFAMLPVSASADLHGGTVRYLVPAGSPPYSTQSDRFDHSADCSAAGGRVWIDDAQTLKHSNGAYLPWYGSVTARLFSPVDTGWVQVQVDMRSDGFAGIVGAGHDPDHDEVVHVATNGMQSYVLAIGPSGTVKWRDTLGWMMSAPIIPIGRREFLAIAGDTAIHFMPNHTTAKTPLPLLPPGTPARYQRLKGNSFLRYYPADGIDRATGMMHSRFIAFETFGLDGAPLHRLRLPAVTDTFDVSIYQNADDGHLFVGSGSEHGAHVSVLDDALNVGLLDATVSQTRERVRHPACLVMHGKLMVVWEDYRNGTADIYGTMQDVDQLWNSTIHIDHGVDSVAHGADSTGQGADSASHHTDSTIAQQRIAGTGGIALRRVFPVPADVWLRAEFTTERDEEITIDVIDMAGRRVEGTGPLTVARGSSGAVIPAHALHPGTYTVVIRTASGATVRARAVVLH